jgi:hypothetical protein
MCVRLGARLHPRSKPKLGEPVFFGVVVVVVVVSCQPGGIKLRRYWRNQEHQKRANWRQCSIVQGGIFSRLQTGTLLQEYHGQSASAEFLQIDLACNATTAPPKVTAEHNVYQQDHPRAVPRNQNDLAPFCGQRRRRRLTRCTIPECEIHLLCVFLFSVGYCMESFWLFRLGLINSA